MNGDESIIKKKKERDNGKETKTKQPRAPHFWEAIVSFLGLIVVMSIGIIIFKVDPHIPMFVGVIIAALISLKLGYKWEAIEEMMVTGISRAMQAILILAIVGMMVGVWLLSGTIPTMIYYGLKLLSPSIFLDCQRPNLLNHIPGYWYFVGNHGNYGSCTDGHCVRFGHADRSDSRSNPGGCIFWR